MMAGTVYAQSADTTPADGSSPIRQVGETPSEDLVRAWDIDISPDGENLPEGSGSVSEGREIFANNCAACHGADGTGGDGMIGGRLVGGEGTLDTDKPVKTVNSYWPYATTLFDYIHRAMPFTAPQSLSDEEVYAVTAYVLNLGGIVPEDAVMDRTSLPRVEMPNRDSFEQMDTLTLADTTACMEDCSPLIEEEGTKGSRGKEVPTGQ
ncbi:MAG: cytochrome c [Fulvimarina manganoxydans]|nr:cytochrome c [Fulvimarina manganoxydans]